MNLIYKVDPNIDYNQFSSIKKKGIRHHERLNFIRQEIDEEMEEQYIEEDD